MAYIQIRGENQTDEEATEVPLEDDGTLTLETLQAQFSGATGVAFINSVTKRKRGLRLITGKFQPPGGAKNPDSWDADNVVYIAIVPSKNNVNHADDVPASDFDFVLTSESVGESPIKTSPNVGSVVKSDASFVKKSSVKIGSKRPHSETSESRNGKRKDSVADFKRIETQTNDLIVLGIPYHFDDDDIKKFFEEYGEVVSSKVKRFADSGRSRGFAFVRFREYLTQKKVLDMANFQLDDRMCEVKIPDHEVVGSKIFVGNVTEDITHELLRNYFHKFADVTDCFVPRPCRGFAFVTFADATAGPAMCRLKHTLEGVDLDIKPAEPRQNEKAATFDRRAGFHSPPASAVRPMSAPRPPSTRHVPPVGFGPPPPAPPSFGAPSGRFGDPRLSNIPPPPRPPRFSAIPDPTAEPSASIGRSNLNDNFGVPPGPQGHGPRGFGDAGYQQPSNRRFDSSAPLPKAHHFEDRGPVGIRGPSTFGRGDPPRPSANIDSDLALRQLAQLDPTTLLQAAKVLTDPTVGHLLTQPSHRNEYNPSGGNFEGNRRY